MNRLEDSFEGRESIDLTSVLSEFLHNDDHPGQIAVEKLSQDSDSRPGGPKKLSQAFDSCVTKSENEEYMKVFLRVRPTNNKSESTITVESDNSIVTNAPESSKRAAYTKTESRHYIFTRVFDSHSQQNEVFEHSTAPMLKKFLDGDNNCVLFAYGMTNAGKTFTVQGSSQNPGILPRLVSAILDHTAFRPNYELHVSMMEIYQENIFDLLGKKREKLAIRDGYGKVEVSKLSYHLINSTEDAFKLMDVAASKRSKSSTRLNTGSSRSHAVYTLTLTRPTADGMQSTQFQLVDLAGAERGNRTKATAAQQKEANIINTSLMILWRCLQSIKKKSSSVDVIPFRESKLTHLLMPILSRAGLGGVSMIACVNPQVDDYDETISILGNASLASKIREFVDMGRVASQVTIPSNHNNTISSTTTTTTTTTTGVPKMMIKLEELKDYKDKHPEATAAAAAAGQKRKRHDSTLSSKHTASSLANSKKQIIKAAGIKTVSITIPEHEISISARSSLSDQTSVTTGSSFSNRPSFEEENDLMIESERKRLRREVIELKDINDQLIEETIVREGELRQEISQEMMIRSSDLLSQIQTLQQELNEYKVSQYNDVTKSCKKVRKNQLLLMQETMSNDLLQEAEEELERMKTIYETNLTVLSQENTLLKQELMKYNPSFVQALPSSNRTSLTTNRQSTTATAILNQNNKSSHTSLSPSNNSVAQEFSSRMQRDGRFHHKKSEESLQQHLVDVENNHVSQPPQTNATTVMFKKSPQRSPLSPVSKNQANSPNVSPTMNNANNIIKTTPMINNLFAGDLMKKDKENNNVASTTGFNKGGGKLSPQRLRREDTTGSGATPAKSQQPQPSSGNYFTRLRSNLIRI